ncbi:MAG: selenium-dependent xanthine dehydrogenase [Bacteroidetes bacterium]|nr:selenium-dependent xanthine dehydrogenase [Bacteroidota bacterium]
MIKFFLNNQLICFSGNEELTLLNYIRGSAGITSVKDGCSGQAACGACMVEIDGKAKLSCTQKLKLMEGKRVITMEGIPDKIREIIAQAYVNKGAVQCGFCTPGLIMRTKVLFGENPNPNREEIKKAINLNLCRCTGYIKIVDAIEEALKKLRVRSEKDDERESPVHPPVKAGIGEPLRKYDAYNTAIGKKLFVNDMHFPGMLYGALRFSDHPRAAVLSVDVSEALKTEGVVRVFTAADVPGERYTGLIFSDWPLMIAKGEITRYIGDVIAGVVATDEETARRASKLIRIDYEVFEPVSDPEKAIEPDSPEVHPGKPNLLERCMVSRGDPIETVFGNSKYVVSGIYETQRIEHAFLETEAAIALPDGDGIRLYSQGQGIYVDQRQVASLLALDEDKVRVTLAPCGGGFGGREDMTVQGHAALFAWHLKCPVLVHLSREESIIMHPKRHPVKMDVTLSCDEQGMFTGLKMLAVGDSGAYASVGTKVMERVAGHASGGYHVPSVDIESLTVYTNNIPSGAMRGFGANQAAFALESCVDELCEKGGFDRWQFRFKNALDHGKMTATGQILGEGVGIKACLTALKDHFYSAKYAGIACGIKNSGVGNGMTDFSDVKISILNNGRVLIEHGWTEMGQGVQNMAIQTLHEETGIAASMIDVVVDTNAGLPTGMTTSSRATALLGNAIIDASVAIRNDISQCIQGFGDIEENQLSLALLQLAGKTYSGKYYCDWTTKPGADVEKIVTHYSYGYAAQLVILNDEGEIEKVYAAHDAGKIMNPMLFEGQIQGAVHMGLGYALTEDLPMEKSRLTSANLRDCGVLTASQTPEIIVIGIEEADPVGPYGAKGIGEIGLVPTAAATANALYQFDKIRRKKLPMKRT